MSAMLVAGLLGFLTLLSGSADSASAAGVAHGQLVPEDVRQSLPVVLDGRVLAHAQVGDRVFVGGNFQQVELTDGSVITQPYLFAYDIDTGIVDPNFRPVINKLVRTLEPTQDGNGLYVGGRFTRWDNSFPLRVARLDAEGNLDNSFTPRASARVQGIVEIGDSVYLGGNFTDLSGVAVTGLAKVDRLTGVVDTTFTPSLTGLINGSQLVRSIEATPDGKSLFVLHYGTFIDDQTREAIAKFDIVAGTPTLSGWNVPWSLQTSFYHCQPTLRDLEISPDGSFLVVAGQGGDLPPNCDSVLRYSTAGDSTVNFDWSARLYSSIFSLAVSDVAVYVGGHFCAAPLNGAPPGGVTSTFSGSANDCDINDPTSPNNPSQVDPQGAVFRRQLAALNPMNGQALDWDPGSNNRVGVFDLTLTDRGLLAGHDGDRFSSTRVGGSGFFDISGVTADTSAPEVVAVSPSADSILTSSPTELTGTATDDREVSQVVVQLRNVATGEHLQTDGSFAASPADLPVTSTVTGIGQVAWSVPVSNLPPSVYEIQSFALDSSENVAPTVTSLFTISGTATCTVTVNGDGEPVIALDQFLAEGLRNIIIRRDGRFVETIDPGSSIYVDTSATPGDHSYLVRWRPGGVTTDVACTPDPVTAGPTGPPPPEPTCSATVVGGSVVVTWDNIGVDRVVIRDDGGWIATVQDVDTYTDTNPAVGERTYLVRYRSNGVRDVTCTPNPITVG